MEKPGPARARRVATHDCKSQAQVPPSPTAGGLWRARPICKPSPSSGGLQTQRQVAAHGFRHPELERVGDQGMAYRYFVDRADTFHETPEVFQIQIVSRIDTESGG